MLNDILKHVPPSLHRKKSNDPTINAFVAANKALAKVMGCKHNDLVTWTDEEGYDKKFCRTCEKFI